MLNSTTSEHYRMLELASRIDTATPRTRIGLLHEELLHTLGHCIAAAEQGRATAGSHHAGAAQSVLAALENSVMMDQDGDLAPSLARVYRACRESLTNAAADTHKLTEIRNAISDIAYAWQALTDS
jgi:flagellar secretion chaperone FliS